MLFLLFHVGRERYCLEASKVIEVAPMVHFNTLPRVPAYVPGLVNYRGAVVPVIDLSAMLTGVMCRPLLSTRIILIDYVSIDKTHHTLGLLAEHVTETISCREDAFQPPGIEIGDARFLSGVIFTEEGMIQKVEVERILPEDVRMRLFRSERGEAGVESVEETPSSPETRS